MRDPQLEYLSLDYKDLGARVKQERQRQKMSQERLAELTNLSMTHMSHIETGNTRLSLPALHKIAWALGVTMDELSCDSIAQAKEIYEGEIFRNTQDCNETEIRILSDTVIAVKGSLRKRLPKSE
jgi:transcriptional regulator with XRE-family HTH domain